MSSSAWKVWAICAIPLSPRSRDAFHAIRCRHFTPAGRPPALRAVEFGAGGVTPPVVIHKLDAQYSKEAMKKKIQGTVTLEFVIDPNGHPRKFKVTRGLGYGLDKKAIEAVGKWEFRPGMKDGQPVDTHATVEVNFRLPKDP